MHNCTSVLSSVHLHCIWYVHERYVHVYTCTCTSTLENYSLKSEIRPLCTYIYLNTSSATGLGTCVNVSVCEREMTTPRFLHFWSINCIQNLQANFMVKSAIYILIY